MNLRAATSSHQPFPHPPSSLAPHSSSRLPQSSSLPPHSPTHPSHGPPSRPSNEARHTSSSLPPHSSTHPSHGPPHSSSHPPQSSSLPPHSATHPSRPSKQAGHASSSLPPHSATHPSRGPPPSSYSSHALAPSAYHRLDASSSQGHTPPLQTTQSAPSTPYIRQPFSATGRQVIPPSIASTSTHHQTSLTAPSTPRGQQRYGQRPNIMPNTPIHPSKSKSQSANDNFNLISRKYGLPIIDFATPLESKITKHNLSHYSERETTSYTPTKITKTAPRKGI